MKPLDVTAFLSITSKELKVIQDLLQKVFYLIKFICVAAKILAGRTINMGVI